MEEPRAATGNREDGEWRMEALPSPGTWWRWRAAMWDDVEAASSRRRWQAGAGRLVLVLVLVLAPCLL